MKKPNKKKKTDKVDVHLYLPLKLIAELDAYVKKQEEYSGYSRPQVIRLAITEYLEKVKA